VVRGANITPADPKQIRQAEETREEKYPGGSWTRQLVEIPRHSRRLSKCRINPLAWLCFWLLIEIKSGQPGEAGWRRAVRALDDDDDGERSRVHAERRGLVQWYTTIKPSRIATT
jgi:hypothetical protein